MFVFIDTNIWVERKYGWNVGRVNMLRELARNGWLKILSNKILLEELKQHIGKDLKATFESYNSFIKKECNIRAYDKTLNLNIMSIQVSDMIQLMKNKCDEYFDGEGILEVPITDKRIDFLVSDFLNHNYPFELSKNNEFKDAIMIYSLKDFQHDIKKKLVILSKDMGFCKAFEGDDNYMVLSDLSEVFKLLENTLPSIVQSQLLKDIQEESIKTSIKEHLSDIEIELGNDYWYDYWCFESDDITDSHQVKVQNIALEDFEIIDWQPSENPENQFNFQECSIKISTQLDVRFDITVSFSTIDEDNSYYDKESGSYIVKNYIHTSQDYEVNRTIPVNFDYYIEDGLIVFEDVTVDSEYDLLELYQDELVEEGFTASFDEGYHMPVYEEYQ